MLPGSGLARFVMGLLVVLIAAGLIMSSCYIPPAAV